MSGIITPPASPGRTFDLPYATLSPADMTSITCNCGHQMFDGRGCCPACTERQQSRHRRLSGRKITQPATPPPDELPSASESRDRGRPLLIPQIAGPRGPSPAAAAMNSAFGSQDEDDCADLFPARLYRTPTRSSTRATSIAQPERTASFQNNEVLLGPIVGRLARPNLPTRGTSGLGLRDYSPMAASFAGITRRQTGSKATGVDARRLSQRSNGELAAQMFDGPA